MKTKLKKGIISFAIWMVLWQLLDWGIGGTAPFAGPFDVAKRLVELIRQVEFWLATGTTFGGIVLGFFVAAILGSVLGYLSYYHEHLETIMSPFIGFFRYIPMISFTLLAIVWNQEGMLVFEVCLFLALPVIYRHTLIALKHSKDSLLRNVWKRKDINMFVKVDLIYRPATMPEYMIGIHRGLNMCCKSGILAQFLGKAAHSVGKSLMEASKNADVAGLFAWTVVIVLLSVGLEQIVLRLLSLSFINETKIDVHHLMESISEEEDIFL